MTAARPDPWCSRLVQLAARLQPAEQRQRYALEFIAELYGMPRSKQYRHSLQVLASALQLRAALADRGASTIQEDAMLIASKAPLRCRLGRHRWHTESTEDGINHWQACALCGKSRRPSFESNWGGRSGVWIPPSGNV